MAPDLGLTSLTSFRKSRLPQTQFESMLNHNTKQMPQDEDDSWEVRAFEEDTTGNLLGCTWPPRSYTCAFCRREFRSAQALGGHMNVHRRDRARLHEMPLVHPSSNISPPPSSAILIPTGREFVGNGLCLLYPYLPANPNPILLPNPPPIDFSSPLPPLVSSACHSPNTPSSSYDNHRSHKEKTEYSAVVVEEELDLELRLGRRHSHGTP